MYKRQEEYNKFYRDKFHDYADPQKVIAVSAEGAVTYKALLFIPGAAPFDFYTKEYETVSYPHLGRPLASSAPPPMALCALCAFFSCLSPPISV